MRTFTLCLLASLVLAAPASAKRVKIGDDWYVRAGSAPTVRVAKGATVTWRWVGRDDHNVVVRKGPQRFRSPLKDSGKYRKRLRKRGTYKIICSIHQPDMRMTLKVR
jgi:plastocyanin